MKKNINIFLLALSIPVTIFALLNIPFIVNFRYYRLALLITLLVESTLLFKNLLVGTLKKEWAKNVGLSLFSTFVILIILEGTFLFMPRSHGSGYSLGGRLWFAKYWKLNSFGYRDDEPKVKTPAIYFIGDSFTAGQGLKNVNERFSNIVKEKYRENGQKVNVINLGENGIATKKEFNTFIEFKKKTGIKPKKIVLQYFGNDIDIAAAENGLEFEGYTVYKDMNPITSSLVKGSFLINYIYWLFPRQAKTSYLDFLSKAYSNEIILKTHKKEIELFINYAKENSAELIAVIFPFMQDLALSNSLYVNKLKSYFDEQKIEYVDVASLSKDLSPKERMINTNDGHASAKVNALVAEELLKKLK